MLAAFLVLKYSIITYIGKSAVFVWPLLTGGCYSEVAVNTGLTVFISLDSRFRNHLLTNVFNKEAFLAY